MSPLTIFLPTPKNIKIIEEIYKTKSLKPNQLVFPTLWHNVSATEATLNL